MTEKKTKLHELIAVFPDTTNVAQAAIEEAKVTFAKKPDHFRGQTRSVNYINEARSSENVTDTKAMVTTVGEKLAFLGKQVSRHWDALLQLEDANQRAKADVIVDGTVIVKDAPATWLLGMENRLKNYREVLLHIPTLDPAMVWTNDELAGKGAYRALPQYVFKTEKTINHKVLYEATKEHPAQIREWSEDVPVAKVEVIHTSGMLTPADKSAMLERCDRIIRAVKQARQRANATEVSKIHAAKAIIDYVHGS